jgi:hypothetical protein
LFPCLALYPCPAVLYTASSSSFSLRPTSLAKPLHHMSRSWHCPAPLRLQPLRLCPLPTSCSTCSRRLSDCCRYQRSFQTFRRVQRAQRRVRPAAASQSPSIIIVSIAAILSFYREHHLPPHTPHITSHPPLTSPFPHQAQCGCQWSSRRRLKRAPLSRQFQKELPWLLVEVRSLLLLLLHRAVTFPTGNCTFTTKALNCLAAGHTPTPSSHFQSHAALCLTLACRAGASAVIIVSSGSDAFFMPGTTETPTGAVGINPPINVATISDLKHIPPLPPPPPLPLQISQLS